MNIDFLVVGVARSGTTSIYRYLVQHPEIVTPKKKEPKFFSRKVYERPLNGKGDDTIKRDIVTSLEEYKECICVDEEGLHGDYSSDYFYHASEVIPEIKKVLTNQPKIVVCLRNPFDRAYSAYMNLKRDSREHLDFLDSCTKEVERIRYGTDWMWHYVNGSLYYESLERYSKEFDNVKVVYYDDLVNDPSKVLVDLCKFLSINDEFKFDTNTIYSASGKPKNSFAGFLTSRTSPIYPLRRYFQTIVPRWILEKVAQEFLFNKVESSIDWREEDITKINSDIDRLVFLTGNTKLSDWKKQTSTIDH